MDKESKKLTYLKSEITRAIKSTDSNRRFYRQQAFGNSMSTSVLAAISTVLLGLKVSGDIEICFSRTALVISALLTIIGAYNAFFNHKDLWVANNDAQNKFRKLMFDIDYTCSDKSEIEDNQVTAWKEQYQKIRDEQNDKWLGLRSTKS